MATSILSINGIGPTAASKLAEFGFKTAEDIAALKVEQLSLVPGFGSIRAGSTISDAKSLLDQTTQDISDQSPLPKSEKSTKKATSPAKKNKVAKKQKKDSKAKKDKKDKKDSKGKKGKKDKKDKKGKKGKKGKKDKKGRKDKKGSKNKKRNK